MNTCPNCKLVNPPDAVRCDCGFNFRSKRMGNDAQSQRSVQPLSVFEIIFTALYGVIGVIGFIFIIQQASGFKKDGFLIKHRKSWQIFWLAFGLHLGIIVAMILYATYGK